MATTVCSRAANVSFWDGYAPWYKLWIEHNRYHDKVIEVLTSMVEPGWRVLDIGAGNGVLSWPLCAMGCEVTAIEPSTGMRNLLFEEAMNRRIDWLSIDNRRWEDAPLFHFTDYDLVMACNSLHLTGQGFSQALREVFKTGATNVFVVSERLPNIKIPRLYGNYSLLFTEYYETESSFAYHQMDEAIEHHEFKKGRMLGSHEVACLKSGLSFKNNHLWLRDTARVGMYWWKLTTEKKVS